ncbi:OmpA family protein, partial [uncultured Kingella sp.]
PASATAAASAATPAAASATASEPAADQADVAYKDAVATFYFATGKSDVAANADKVVADLVAAGKNGKKLIVSGYTDSTGNAATNAELSKKRAQAVQAFLEKQGVDAKNIELRKPENTTAAAGNNAQGRRVEVKAE